MVIPENTCPVCGFRLWCAPWDGPAASLEFCPSCGIQFGYDDMAGGEASRRQAVYEAWRARWISTGMPWSSRGIEPPPGWDPVDQLRRIGVNIVR